MVQGSFMRHYEIAAEGNLKSTTPRRFSPPISAGIEGHLAYQENRDHPYRNEIAFRRASGELYLSNTMIDQELRRAISEWGRRVLQTTTVDPGRKTGGFIYADR